MKDEIERVALRFTFARAVHILSVGEKRRRG